MSTMGFMETNEGVRINLAFAFSRMEQQSSKENANADVDVMYEWTFDARTTEIPQSFRILQLIAV